MPIYEYQCRACGERTEILQRLDEAPLAHCPRCGGPMTKLISAPAFQFKGSGWYVTDYAGKGKGATAPTGPAATRREAPPPGARRATRRARRRARRNRPPRATERARAGR